jgi:hypothetical protein
MFMMTSFTYRRAWILSSPAAEGRARKIDFRLPVSPLRKILGAWAERAGVSPPACQEGRGFLPPTSRQISQSKVMQEPAIKRATQQGLL